MSHGNNVTASVGIRKPPCVGHRVEHGRDATQPSASVAPSPA
jgi:hypothetical protein